MYYLTKINKQDNIIHVTYPSLGGRERERELSPTGHSCLE